MLTHLESFTLVAISVATSLLFMFGINRIWPWEKRHAHNDVIGWQLSVLGTTYAVILGFMLYTVWTDFSAAGLNVDFEANALVNVYRLAEGLPSPQRTQMEALTRSYADVVLDKDWPAMSVNQVPENSYELDREMWKTLMSVKTASPTEVSAQDHALSELTALTEHRRTRMLQSTTRLPAVLWTLLIVGGAVTIASASMFGSENTVLHALQVFAFSFLVALVLVAIADIDRPFQGSVHVSEFAFKRAQMNMKAP